MIRGEDIYTKNVEDMGKKGTDEDWQGRVGRSTRCRRKRKLHFMWKNDGSGERTADFETKTLHGRCRTALSGMLSEIICATA